MPYNPILVGAAANDGTGDNPRDTGIKINAMFLELYGLIGGTAAPMNNGLPIISGTGSVGQTLTTTDGTWTGSPTSFTYQWTKNGVAIGGATNASYVIQAGDAGALIRVEVTATNAVGEITAVSDPISIVVPVQSGIRFHGSAVGGSLTDAQIRILGSDVSSVKGATITDIITAEAYYYYIYPASFGDLATAYLGFGTTVDTTFNQLGGFIKTTQLVIPDTQPSTPAVLYNVYRSEFTYLPATVTHQFI